MPLTNFADLHVLPKVDDIESSRKLAETIRVAGYRSVALTIPTGLLIEQVRAVKECFEKAGLATHSRVDLICANRHELLRLLRRFRNQYDVVSVRCTNQNVAAVACRDRRVDVVFFDQNRNIKFTHTLANLLDGALEFNLSFLLHRESVETINRAIRQIAIARDHNSKIILSSGCTSSIMVRHPLQIRAVGITLGLTDSEATNGVSSIPSSILESNSERRSPLYIEEGVRIIKGKRSR